MRHNRHSREKKKKKKTKPPYKFSPALIKFIIFFLQSAASGGIETGSGYRCVICSLVNTIRPERLSGRVNLACGRSPLKLASLVRCATRIPSRRPPGDWFTYPRINFHSWLSEELHNCTSCCVNTRRVQASFCRFVHDFFSRVFSESFRFI